MNDPGHLHHPPVPLSSNTSADLGYKEPKRNDDEKNVQGPHSGGDSGGHPGGRRRRRRVRRYAWWRHDHSVRTRPWRRAVPREEVRSS